MTGRNGGFSRTYLALALLVASAGLAQAAVDLAERTTPSIAAKATADVAPQPIAGRLPPAGDNARTAALSQKADVEEHKEVSAPRKHRHHKAKRTRQAHNDTYYVVRRPMFFRPFGGFRFGRRW
jgi:hypothetical protein